MGTYDSLAGWVITFKASDGPERVGGKICWSDFVMLIECAVSTSIVIKYIDKGFIKSLNINTVNLNNPSMIG